MPTITINEKKVETPTGTPLIQLLKQDLSLPCGGHGRCGKCRIFAEGDLSPLTEEEKSLLSKDEIQNNIRLACCTKVLGNSTVKLYQTEKAARICTDTIVPWEAPSPMFSEIGAAIDIGTTTLAANLYDRKGIIASSAMMNPQSAFGADVITRIDSALSGNDGELAFCIRNAISHMLKSMCKDVGRRSDDIDGLVITGNTAMLYLLDKISPAPLASAPFQVREKFGTFISSRELELPCSPEAKVYLPRCISAFVGADITTALLTADICKENQTAMLADIGTNGEIVLWHKGKLICCSTAVGPAFEGANLSQGMQGAPGAIDHAYITNGQINIHTIEDFPAVGICGSGIVDILACLLDMELLDETGLLGGGTRSHILTDSVSVTQEDIRQIQLAKSAVRAGIETLLQQADITPDQLCQLSIAGGFGSYLDLKNAGKIGLLPEALIHTGRVLGNAALAGAAILLGNTKRITESCALADSAETAELSNNPIFVNKYVEYMMF